MTMRDKIDSRGRPAANKYRCSRCDGTGDEPEATDHDMDVLVGLQKHLDDLSVPRDQHDAMSAAAQVIEQLSATIRRHRQDRHYVSGFSDGFDATIDVVNKERLLSVSSDSEGGSRSVYEDDKDDDDGIPF